MRTIYTFGDSHTCLFDKTKVRLGCDVQENPKVRFVDKSAILSTAYNLIEHDSTVKEILASIPFNFNDEMWFVFGEIDIRFNVFYQHQELKITLEKSIELLAAKYTKYVRTLTDLGYPVKIVSVIPTQRNPVPHRYDPLKNLSMLNPMRGNGITIADRVYITECLNSKIRYKCSKLGIGFIDVYPLLVDTDGCIDPSKTFDNGMHGYYIGDLVIDRFNLERQA